MARASAAEAENRDWEPIVVTTADFVAAPDEGSTIAAGEVAEVFRAEIGEDGQLSSYDLVRLGDRLGETGRSAKGKLFGIIKDTANAAVPDTTEIRFVARPKNQNGRTPLTNWFPVRDLDRDNPEQRLELPPVTYNGRPAYVKDGRILAMEVRNGGTSIEVSLANSTLDVPSRGGY